MASSANLSNSGGGMVTASPGGTTLLLSGGTTPRPYTGSADVTPAAAGIQIKIIPAGTLRSTGGEGVIPKYGSYPVPNGNSSLTAHVVHGDGTPGA